MFRNADQAVVSGHRHEPTGNVGARKLLHIEMIDEKSREVRKTEHIGGLINEIVFVLIVSVVRFCTSGRLWYQTSFTTFSTARGYSIARGTETALFIQSYRATRRNVFEGGHVYCTEVVQLCWSGQKCSRQGDNRAEKGSGSATRQCDAVYYGTSPQQDEAWCRGPLGVTTRFGKELANEDICEQRCTNRGSL